MLPVVLADGLFGVVPWSIVALLVVIAIGFFLIRAAISLVKVLILVAIGVGVYLLVQFVLKNFGA
jgi:hypothetical protein